jgi:ribonuclease HI
MPTDLPHIEIFTDGACSGNPGPGGWAYILRQADSGKEVEASGGDPRTTNNKMELLAAIHAMERLDQSCRIDLYSDSQYLTKGLTEWLAGWKRRGWKRGKNDPVKNLDLWKRLDSLQQTHTINPIWVRGHADHPENERCDTLAVAAAKRAANGELAPLDEHTFM